MTFWNWAVAAYAGEGVAEACLALQDEHGQCVPLLLWAAWQAESGREISDMEANSAANLARPWAVEVIESIRAVRRRLKTELAEGDDAVRLPLREKIKAAELAAEKALMAQLEALPADGKLPETKAGQALADLCRTNLLVTIRAWGEKIPSDGADELIHALTKGDFLRYNSPL